MRNFKIVFGMEFRETVRSRSFIVLSVIFALVLVGAAGFSLLSGAIDAGAPTLIISEELPEVMPDQSGTVARYTVAAEDRSGEGILDALEQRLPIVKFERCRLTDEVIASALEEGVDGCVVIDSLGYFDYYGEASLYGDTAAADIIQQGLTDMAREKAFAALGVSPSDANDAMHIRSGYVLHEVGGFGFGRYMMSTVMSILLFITITLYGQMVAMRITAEKGSRTIEVLATSVSPEAMLCGKVLGVGAAALSQLALFLALLCAVEGGGILQQLIGITVSDAVWMCLYFLLGFALIAFIYGGLGAMVSQTEDLSVVSSLPMMLVMPGYLIAVLAVSVGRSGPLLSAASFVPFWSPMVMFSRMAMEQVGVWQILLSLGILLITTVLAAKLSARLYRRGMLRYGKPPKIKEIIGALKK